MTFLSHRAGESHPHRRVVAMSWVGVASLLLFDPLPLLLAGCCSATRPEIDSGGADGDAQDASGDVPDSAGEVPGSCDPVSGQGCPCDPVGSTSPCAAVGVGACANGTRTCVASGEFGAWGSCVAGTATPEVCDGIDNDCNGVVDDGCCGSMGSLVWSWEANDTSGWSISSGGLDCCGCYSCGVCADNTSLSASGGIATFDSGPMESAGNNHQQDGFSAASALVTVAPGFLHRIEIDIANLDANILGNTGPESGPAYFPTWTLEVHDGTTVVASIQRTWATPQCLTCSPTPADLGVQSATFTPSGSTVGLVLWTRLRSSQCSCEVYGIRVDVDYIRIFQTSC